MGNQNRYSPANENATTLLDEIRELQTQLEDLAMTAGFGDAGPRLDPTGMEREVRSILRLRADRARIFGDGLFGEPAWDMLLDLYAADLSGHPESVSSACTASGVAPSTALRWLQLLQRKGWIERSLDYHNSQRFFLALSDKSRLAMRRFFAHPEYTGTRKFGRDGR